MAVEEGNSAERKPNSAPITANKDTSPAAKPDVGVLMPLYKYLKDLIEPVGKTVVAFDAMSKSGPAAAAVISDIAGFGGSIGRSAAQFVGALDKARQDTNKAAAQGLGGLDTTDLALQLSKGRMSTQEYLELMSKAGPYLQTLGKNANDAGHRLTQMTDEINNDKSIGPVLTKYGINLDKELAHIQAIGSMNATQLNLANEKDRAKLEKANANLALQIQNQANLTGKSREAIEGELEERLKMPEIAAAMRLMTEDQRESFIKTQVALSGLGKEAQGVSATLAIGGRLTEEQRNYLMTLGPKARAEFERASRMSVSRDEKTAAAGRALMQKAMADAAQYRGSADYARVERLGGPLAETYKKAQQEDLQSQRVLQAQRENQALSPTQALQKTQKDAGYVRAGESVKPQETMQNALNKTEEASKRAGTSAADTLNKYVKLDGGAKELSGALDHLNKTLFDTKDSGDKARDALKDVIKELNNIAGTNKKTGNLTTNPLPTAGPPTAPATNPLPNAAPNTTPSANPLPNAAPNSSSTNTTPANPLPNAAPNSSSTNTTPANPLPNTTPNSSPTNTTPANPLPNTTPNSSPTNTTPANPLPNASPSSVPTTTPSSAPTTTPSSAPTTTPSSTPVVRPSNPLPSAPPPVSRANTSLGEIGSLIEKFSPMGTPALLHNEEGVVNLDQLNNIAKGSRDNGIQTALASLREGASKKQSLEMPNISTMLSGIQTKVSSISKPRSTYDPSFVTSALRKPEVLNETTELTKPNIEVPQTNFVSSGEQVSLKDVNDTLMRLNTGIMQLVANSSKAVTLNSEQVRATKSLSGNKFA